MFFVKNKIYKKCTQALQTNDFKNKYDFLNVFNSSMTKIDNIKNTLFC